MIKRKNSSDFVVACLHQIVFSRLDLGLVDVRTLVDQPSSFRYPRSRIPLTEVLVRCGDNYEVLIGTTRIAIVDRELVDQLPAEYFSRPEGHRGSIIAMLLLTQLKEDRDRIEMDPPGLASISKSADRPLLDR
jgi:hypothetical protein